MLPELGHFLLMLALMTTLVQAVFSPKLPDFARRAPLVQLGCVAGAFLILIFCYVVSDFSVMNVAMNSHTAKPLLYKITGAWGNHEGSILLWINVLALFGAGLAWQKMPETYEATRRKAVAIQAGLQAGVLLFLLLTSNPFERLYPVPFEGRSLNPLLQDIGLAMHPPTLYMGYVGFAIVFCLAVAALLHGTVTRDLARILRPWVLIPWGLLTFGIGLGGWWAYRELGWGGWWFWDPVENASLLPWLAGTALLHSVVVLEKRGGLALWAVLLSIITFSFSLMGTFLVRSGLITSVHSFASDPERGIFILAYLGMVTGGALLVFAYKAPRTPTQPFAPFTREGAIVANNLILIAAAASILLATTYPMMQELTGARPLTIGAPYFNKTVLPLLAPLVLLAGIGPLLGWTHTLRPRLKPAFALAVIGGIAGAFLYPASLWAVCGSALAGWLIAACVLVWKRIPSPSFRHYGMLLSHVGLALFCVALTFSSLLKEEYELHLAPGETKTAGAYTLHLFSLDHKEVENYLALRGHLEIRKGEHAAPVALYPELRNYEGSGGQTTEAAIHSSLGGDLYAVLRKPSGNPDNALDIPAEGIILSLYVNPLMQLLWFSILCMGAGGLIALLPRTSVLKKE